MFRLDRETLVPLGLMVVVVLSSISATIWINTTLLNLSYKVSAVDEKIGAMALRIEAIQQGWWTQADMRAWVKLARAHNAGNHIVWPDPDPVVK